jgi:glycosidase
VNDPASVLSYYKKMIRLRESSETLKYGAFKPLLATNALLMYSRKAQGKVSGEAPPSTEAPTEGSETYIAVFNVSPRRIKLNRNARALLRGEVAASNIGRTAWDTLKAPAQETVLESWEALVLRTK